MNTLRINIGHMNDDIQHTAAFPFLSQIYPKIRPGQNVYGQ